MRHHPWVAENFSHITALMDLLEALDGKAVTVRASATTGSAAHSNVAALVDALSTFQKRGGTVPWTS